MAIHEALESAMRNEDYEGYLKLLHKDYEFVRHQTGVTVSLDEWKPVVQSMFEAKKVGNLSWETFFLFSISLLFSVSVMK